MNTWLNRWRAFRGELAFYRILRDWAAQQEGGSTVMAEFESDRQQGRSLLRHFLQTQLTDEIARKELIEALGNRHNQFVNVVTNSQVGKIVNIAEAGAVYWKITVFSDVRQVVVLVGMIVLVAAALGAGVWYLNQPRVLKGDFNIAVALFEQNGSVTVHPDVAKIVSDSLADFLTEQYQGNEIVHVEIGHERIGIIGDDLGAEKLAQRVNAHLVIYGTVVVQDNVAALNPNFYVTDAFAGDVTEIGGGYQFTHPVTFTLESLTDPESSYIAKLKQQAQFLVFFTEALIHLSNDDLFRAGAAIDRAAQEAQKQTTFGGLEVIYLFASHITRLKAELLQPGVNCEGMPDDAEFAKLIDQAQTYLNKALTSNPQYGRGWIAQGNMAYTAGNLAMALEPYNYALRLTEQPVDDFLAEKAHLGLGNVYRVQYQCVHRNSDDVYAAAQLANLSLEHYQKVIEGYNKVPHAPIRLRELAAQAYYLAAVVYQEGGMLAAAAAAANQTIQLTQLLQLQQRADQLLSEVSTPPQ